MILLLQMRKSEGEIRRVNDELSFKYVDDLWCQREVQAKMSFKKKINIGLDLGL